MIHSINYFFTRVFDALLSPFESIHEFWGILFLSIIMSFVVLVIYKFVSFPAAVKNAKDKIKGNILAIRIYKDFWQVIVASFFKSLIHTMRYFILNFGPLIVIIPILFPMFSQMDVRYRMRPFQVGEEIIVKASFQKDPIWLDVQLEENEHVKAKMAPVFINAYRDEDKTQPLQEVSWKLEAVKEGKTTLKFKVKDRVFEKTLVIGDYLVALSEKKWNKSNLEHFIYPVEPLYEGYDTLEYVYIEYPYHNVEFMGIGMHWIIWNLILVLIIVLALHKKFGIEF